MISSKNLYIGAALGLVLAAGTGFGIDNSGGLALNSGTIKDLAGNDATRLTFSAVGPNNLFQVK